MSFKHWLYFKVKKWALRSDDAPAVAIDGSSGARPAGETVATVSLRPAVNGHILELGIYKPNPRGSDWTYTSYVVGAGESLNDAVTTLLVTHQLNK